MAKAKRRTEAAEAVGAGIELSEAEVPRQRQVIYWRTLGAVFGLHEQAPNIEAMAGELADAVGMPRAILDPIMAVDTLLQRYPELKADFDALEKVCTSHETEAPREGEAPAEPVGVGIGSAGASPSQGALRRALAFSKLLLNVLGPNTLTPTVTAEQYRAWQQECNRLGACFGLAPGSLCGGGAPGAAMGGGRQGGGCRGVGRGSFCPRSSSRPP